jgi:hypothetical protein
MVITSCTGVRRACLGAYLGRALTGLESPNHSSERRVECSHRPSPQTETGWRTWSWIPKPRLTSGPCPWRAMPLACGQGNLRFSCKQLLTNGTPPSRRRALAGVCLVELKSGACPRTGPHAAHVVQLMTNRSCGSAGSGRISWMRL